MRAASGKGGYFEHGGWIIRSSAPGSGARNAYGLSARCRDWLRLRTIGGTRGGQEGAGIPKTDQQMPSRRSEGVSGIQQYDAERLVVAYGELMWLRIPCGIGITIERRRQLSLSSRRSQTTLDRES